MRSRLCLVAPSSSRECPPVTNLAVPPAVPMQVVALPAWRDPRPSDSVAVGISWPMRHAPSVGPCTLNRSKSEEHDKEYEHKCNGGGDELPHRALRLQLPGGCMPHSLTFRVLSESISERFLHSDRQCRALRAPRLVLPHPSACQRPARRRPCRERMRPTANDMPRPTSSTSNTDAEVRAAISTAVRTPQRTAHVQGRAYANSWRRRTIRYHSRSNRWLPSSDSVEQSERRSACPPRSGVVAWAASPVQVLEWPCGASTESLR